MSSELSRRREQLDALSQVVRAASAAGVLLSQTVAERVGLNPADMECLDLLVQEGPATAGRLAEVTGFTTGSVTGLIDRLEKAGYARRVPNPRDRRSVLVEPQLERIAGDIGPYYASVAQAMAELCEGYNNDELTLITGFLERMHQGSLVEIARLRAEHPTNKSDKLS